MIEKLFDILKNISDIIAEKRDYRAMLSEIVCLLATRLEAKVCSVYVYNKETDDLELIATYGLKPASVGSVKMKPGEGITGMSFKENKIMNIRDPEVHPSYKHFKNIGEEKYKSLLAIPLNIATQCIGVLVIQSTLPECFVDSVVEMAKSISTQLANLVLNANILDSLAQENQPQPIKKTAVHNAYRIIDGVAGNTGTAIGKAYIFKTENPFSDILPALHLNDDKELELLSIAIEKTIEETLILEKKALSMITEADASIFYAHILFLEDKTLSSKIRDEIYHKKSVAEYAIKTVYEEYNRRFSVMEEQIFKEKAMDLKDVMSRLLHTVLTLKKKNLSEIGWRQEWSFENKENLIIVASEILPSDLLRIPANDVKGIICEKGGVSAHISILAKALNIPALMKAKNATTSIYDGDEIILDCFSEKAHVQPTEELKQHYCNILNTKQDETLPYKEAHLPSVTFDGVQITLKANIGLISETTLVNKYFAKGIGLYRTEFLYMIRDRLPTEQEQFEIYSKIFNYVDCKNVTIRALDAGADKPLPYLKPQEEDNPAMGNRGVRLLLSCPEILKPHLKAILRAGAKGNLKILLPMISTLDEIKQIKKILAELEYELDSLEVKYSKDYQLGIMIEVPSVIPALKEIINQIDFVSIGTNDLLQYVFASDRTNETAQNKNLQLHPVFIRIIKNIADTCAKKGNFPVSICGEIAGIAFVIPILLGAGIHELSMPPKMIPQVKDLIRKLTLSECKKITQKAISLTNENEVISLLNNFFITKNIKMNQI